MTKDPSYDLIHPSIRAFIAQEIPPELSVGSTPVKLPSKEALAKVEAILAAVQPDPLKVVTDDLARFMRTQPLQHSGVADYIDANLQMVQNDIDLHIVTPAAFQRAAMFLQAAEDGKLTLAPSVDLVLDVWIKHHAAGVLSQIKG